MNRIILSLLFLFISGDFASAFLVVRQAWRTKRKTPPKRGFSLS
jgi:hypothetical protein